MVLRCNREQLVKKYEGKLYNSRNSWVTEQVAKAGCRGTSTGDIQGSDESPICQGWFRCNQTCHNVQQWPGWCTGGLFSPKWVCDLSFVPNSVCGTVCMSVCIRFLMFLCTSAAQMSPGLYHQLIQTLFLFLSCPFAYPQSVFSSVSTFISSLLPLYFNVISCLFMSSFHIYFCMLSCWCTCAWACAHTPFSMLPALLSSCLSHSETCRWRRAGRRRNFLSIIRTAGNHPVQVWKPWRCTHISLWLW